MQTLESQLFVITFVLALLIIIIFLYKVMINALGGPDKKEKRKCKKNAPAETGSEALPARRPVVRREENTEGGGAHG